MNKCKTTSNICLPLIHQWFSSATKEDVRIDNLVIINHPEDAERICKDHVKKAPVFKSFLYNSIISTTDNDDWKAQRYTSVYVGTSAARLSALFSASMVCAEPKARSIMSSRPGFQAR